jgi:putative glutamine amidotransferase
MPPLIGITCSRKVGPSWAEIEPWQRLEIVPEDYIAAIVACGGAPVLIPVLEDAKALKAVLCTLHGLLLSGGPDVNPLLYGEEPLQALGQIDEELDRMEIRAIREAMDMDLPILGICRGIQVLNVALGGRLYQDIASQVRGAIKHRQEAAKRVKTHSVDIEPGTLLHKITGQEKLQVNSRHHQGVREPAPSLRACARASDGVVEGIEAADRRFVMGIQWHPDGLWSTDSAAKRILTAFIEAADAKSR